MKFIDRLLFIKGLRPVSAWERETGIGRGGLDRALKDGQLNEINLRKLCRAENVNAHWLLFGTGMPYSVMTFGSDAALAGQLQAYFDDEAERWTLTVMRRHSDGLPCAIALSMPTEHQAAGEVSALKMITLELLAGPIGLLSAQWICRSGWACVRGVSLDDAVVADVLAGQLGSQALLFDPGYLVAAVPLDSRALQVLETSAANSNGNRYHLPLTPAENALLSQFRALPDGDKKRLNAIADALAGLRT